MPGFTGDRNHMIGKPFKDPDFVGLSLVVADNLEPYDQKLVGAETLHSERIHIFLGSSLADLAANITNSNRHAI